MKISPLNTAPPEDPWASIVEQALEIPLSAFIVARGDLYRIGSRTPSTDLLLRTGSHGFVTMGHSTAKVQRRTTGPYLNKPEAEQWMRHHLDSGASLTVVDPTVEA
jgi:hypothetical protein